MLVAILVSMMITALALMLAFPQTPTGKWLHRILVEAPARLLLDLTWVKAGRGLLLGAAFVIVSLAAPEMTVLFASPGLDAAAMAEVMIVVWAASLSGGAAAAWRTTAKIAVVAIRLVRGVFMLPNRPRIRRHRKIRSQRKGDDQAGPGWAFA